MEEITKPNQNILHLTELLNEMYDFVNNILTHLPPNLQETAKSLMQKTCLLTETNFSPYLNMNRKKIHEVINEYVEPNVSTNQENTNYEIPNSVTDLVEQTDEFPFGQISAQKMCLSAVKCGSLMRQGHFWYIKRLRKCYAAIQGNWLIIYISDRCTRPQQFVNLLEYVAQPVSVKNNGPNTLKIEETNCFEIKSNADNRKTYQFIAASANDMEQWINAINKISNRTETNKSARQLPLPPNISTLSSSDYEIVNSSNRNDFDTYATVQNTPIYTPITENAYYSNIPQVDNDQSYDDIGHIEYDLPKNNTFILNTETKTIRTKNIFASILKISSRNSPSKMRSLENDIDEDKYEIVESKRSVPLFTTQNSFLHSCKLK